MDKNKSHLKLWRLTKVLYFIITLPLVLFGAGALLFLQEIHRGNYDLGIRINDYYIGTLYMILFLLSYILLTDFIRRIISYINNGTFNGFIPYIEILKRFFILIIIIGGIMSVILVSLSQNLRNECTGNNEGFNDYGICSCDELYIRENGVCKKNIKSYDNGEISFTYPGKLIVDNKEFEDFKFFEKENIIVKKYNFDTIVSNCLNGLKNRLDGEVNGTMGEWKGRIKTKEEANKVYSDKKIEYKKYINGIKDGNLNAWNKNFDHFTCNVTEGPISVKPIEIDGIKGVIINYYFTQDDNMACLSQFNTELLLIKDLDNIYSILFKNNFGNVLDYLNQFKGEYGEACLIDSQGEFRSKVISDNIVNFYKNGTSLYGTDYEGFEKNYYIIKEIINTVKIK